MSRYRIPQFKNWQAKILALPGVLALISMLAVLSGQQSSKQDIIIQPSYTSFGNSLAEQKQSGVPAQLGLSFADVPSSKKFYWQTQKFKAVPLPEYASHAWVLDLSWLARRQQDG